MNNTVYKYEFPIEDSFELLLPHRPIYLMVGLQGNTPCMWCKVNPDVPKKKYQFHVTGTGHPVNAHWEHVGSFQQTPFVWHLWREV